VRTKEPESEEGEIKDRGTRKKLERECVKGKIFLQVNGAIFKIKNF